MTGLDLEPFLRLLRADLGVWISLGAIAAVLAAMAWTSWGSRRALRKCLVLSILAHVGLLFYGGRFRAETAGVGDGPDGIERIRSIRVVRAPDTGVTPSAPGDQVAGAAAWDRPVDLLAAAGDPRLLARADPAPTRPDRLARPEAIPSPTAPRPDSPASEPPSPPVEPSADAPPVVAPTRPEEMPDLAPAVAVSTDPDAVIAARTRPDRPKTADPIAPARPKLPADARSLPPSPLPRPPDAPSDLPTDAPIVANRPAPEAPPAKVEAATAPDRGAMAGDGDLRSRPRVARAVPSRTVGALPPVTIARGPMRGPSPPPVPSRPMDVVPETYKARLDPDRSALALRLGASDASEQAVDRALDWLARHQDADGRWNAGTKKYSDGSAVDGEANFTALCPPGDRCSGECFYFEADTAMTGLALLAFLGAGHTHDQADGKYAATVAKGLQFLLRTQKPDGDLRGESRAVGMYCHAMASLALCEAYALSRDDRLRSPAEKAVNFLLRSRAADGLSWRYQPGAPSGDTSLLGWAVLVFKSAQDVGLPVPTSARTGALSWLNLVSEGKDRGLAVYRPKEGPYGGAEGFALGRNMTPTMTAEAWACRQFLGVGGPGPASDEAARYLGQNRPSAENFNLYYWYYGTLALFQRGGEDWSLWNARVRDQLVSLQKTSGHESGSWDPRDSRGRYDSHGGRIYCTALGAMTLEVYYRYARPSERTPRVAPGPDATLRRTSQGSGSRP